MVSFFPPETSIVVKGYVNWSAEFLSDLEGTELGRLIDLSIETEKQEDGSFKVLSQGTANADLPYALAIETPQVHQPCLDGIKLQSKILFIRVVMGILKPIIPIARWLRLILGR